MKKIRPLVKPIIFILLCVLVLSAVYRVLSWKDTMGPYESAAQQLYATPPGLIDVVFTGSSHCYGGVNPDLMWEENGIAAFNMAVSGQDTKSCVHHMREVLKTQRPKVVVADIYASAFETSVYPANVYRNILALRTSINSVSLVKESFPAGERADYILRWPIVHTRYRELEKFDFISYPPSDFGRGFCIRYGITPVTPTPEIYLADEKEALTDLQKAFVDDLYAMSTAYGFDLVLMLLPCEMTLPARMAFNAVLAYAGELGLKTMDLNLLREEIGYDYQTDFLDADHLNLFGAEKTSRHLASFLKETYDLPDRRGDADYALWDKSASFNRHVQLEYDFSALDAVGLAGRLAQEEGLVVVCTLQGDYASSPLPLRQVVKALGAPDDFWDTGGTLIKKDGAVTAFVPPQMTNIFLSDADRYTSVRIADMSTEETGCLQEIRMGDAILEPANGLGIMIYDLYRQKVIGSKWF